MLHGRRRLLGALAAGSVLGGGCLGRLDPAAEGTPATPTPAPAAAVGCPPYDRRDVDRVVCSTAPPADALVFEPEAEVAQLPRVDLTCRLENDRASAFASNFYDATLHRWDGDRWWFLGPYAVAQPLHRLPPGETHRRLLVVDNTDLARPRPPDVTPEGTDYVTARHGLGPGTYALAIASGSEGPETRYAAAFTLRGDPVPLLAPDTVTGTSDDGAKRVVAVEPLHGGEVDRLTMTVERLADPPREPHPLVDEQLYNVRFVGLRAAFAHLEEGVRTVVVRGDDSQFTRGLASGFGPNFVSYAGETVQLRVDPYDR